MDRALETMVRERAGRCCEYCRAPEELSSMPFQLDHVIAEQHAGPTAASNLALACFVCNGNGEAEEAGFGLVVINGKAEGLRRLNL